MVYACPGVGIFRFRAMTVHTPRFPASGKIGMALLLGVAMALATPGDDLAWGQSSAESQPGMPSFIAVDLLPRGFTDSGAYGISGGQQVGDGSGQATWGHTHALLWRGRAAGVADLTPDWFLDTQAVGISGGQQVGWGSGLATWGHDHALLWSGSASSAVDLHPGAFANSAALGIFGGQQVGWGSGPATGGHHHALLWKASAASVVDLHPGGFDSTEALGISGDQQVGWGSGPATGGNHHALAWKGSPASVADLHPSGFTSSEALGISGDQQAGWGSGPATKGQIHALLWRGSAASVVDLHPSGFDSSQALGISGSRQAGWGAGAATGYHHHALVWRGSAGSAVDLHAFLPPGFEESNAFGVDPSGIIVGDARPRGSDRPHAFLWAQYVDVKPAPVRPAANAVAPQVRSAPRALGIYTNGPVELILTDPQGRRTGYDPVHNTSLQEIPVSNYSKTTLRAEHNPSAPDPPPLKALDVANQLGGQYTLEVVGTDSGDFTVYVKTSDARGNRITQSYSGTTSPGRSSQFTFPGEVTIFTAFAVTLGINSASKAFEVNGTFTAGPGGMLSPDAQPVTIELGAFLATIPAGSFAQTGQGMYAFVGTVKGVALEANLAPTGDNGYFFSIKGANVPNLPTDNPLKVGFAIGNNGGSVDVNAEFVR